MKIYTKKYQEKYRQRPEWKEQNSRYQGKYQQSGKWLAKHHEYRNRNALWVADYKTEQGCLLCGEDCASCLDFHHDGNKETEVCRLVASGASLKRLQREIDKCSVLCANCHRKVNAGLITLAPKV